jgi:phosphohistidine phosphatase
MRTLYLLRHAKSSWDNPSLADHDRPLSPRGQRAAARLAEYLRGEHVQPATALCSTANRACQTLELIAPALAQSVEVHLEDSLYGATAGELLDRLRLFGSEDSVLLVGHNPAIRQLALGLAGDGVTSAFENLRAKFPTAALATLTTAAPWRRLDWGGAFLESFVRPRELGA